MMTKPRTSSQNRLKMLSVLEWVWAVLALALMARLVVVPPVGMLSRDDSAWFLINYKTDRRPGFGATGSAKSAASSSSSSASSRSYDDKPGEAQNRFGNAKGISSDMFFDRMGGGNDDDYGMSSSGSGGGGGGSSMYYNNSGTGSLYFAHVDSFF